MVGGVRVALADTPTTYCEFQAFAPTLCASNAISIAPVVTPTNNTVTITLSSNTQLNFGYQFEVVLSNSKVLANTALTSVADDPGILHRQVVPVLQGATQASSIQVSTSFGAPFYVFYRLSYLSDPSDPGSVLYSTPWKVYAGNDGTPSALCAESNCGPEIFSTKVGDQQWFTRVTVDRGQAAQYSLVADGVSTPLAGSCPDILSFQYNALEATNPACYISNTRKVFLAFSASPTTLIKAVTSSVNAIFNIQEVNSATGQRIGQLILGVPQASFKTYMGAILDKASSIDNLDDVFADLNIRYANLGSVGLVLGSGSPDGTGIEGRNGGWLYPKLLALVTPLKNPDLLLDMWKKVPIDFFYSGILASESFPLLYRKDDFDVDFLRSPGINVYARSSDNTSMIPLGTWGNDNSIIVNGSSDLFQEIVRDGLWIEYDANVTDQKSAKLSVHGIQLVTANLSRVHDPVIKEDYSSRENVFASNLYYADPLNYKSGRDSLYIHKGANREMLYDNQLLLNPKFSLLSNSDADKFSVRLDGDRLSISQLGTANRNDEFLVLLSVDNGETGDPLLVPIKGRILDGVYYVVVGMARQEDDIFIKWSKQAALYDALNVLADGYEPHLIYTKGLGNFMSPNGKDHWYYPDSTIKDSNGNLYDIWGMNGYQLSSCLDGVPYSWTTNPSLCGTPGLDENVLSQKISGISYFGHSNKDIGGEPITGIKFQRRDLFANNNGLNYCITAGRKDCWIPSNQISVLSDKEVVASWINDIKGGSNIIETGAPYYGYSCNEALPVKGSPGFPSFIQGFSSNYGFTSRGIRDYIMAKCVTSKDLDVCPENLLKYVSVKSKNVDLRSLVDDNFPGTLLKSPIWNHVVFDRCTPNADGVPSTCENAVDAITPGFFDPIGR